MSRVLESEWRGDYPMILSPKIVGDLDLGMRDAEFATRNQKKIPTVSESEQRLRFELSCLDNKAIDKAARHRRIVGNLAAEIMLELSSACTPFWMKYTPIVVACFTICVLHLYLLSNTLEQSISRGLNTFRLSL